MPGAAPELLIDASRFLMRLARLAEAGRRSEREPGESFWTTLLQRAQERQEEAERRLLNAGVSHETLERLGDLYPLAVDLHREHRASMELERDHGCAKCLHCFWSWERTRGDPESAVGPFCEIFGDVPAFCFDFGATRFCGDCGIRISPEKVAESDPIAVKCAAYTARDLAA